MTKVNKTSKVSITNLNTVEPISDSDLEMYATWLATGNLPDGGETEIDRIASQVVNLGDTSAIVRYLVDLGKQGDMRTLSMLIQRLSVMEFILTDKLGISITEMQEYNERYFKELAEAKAMMTEDAEEEEANDEA